MTVLGTKRRSDYLEFDRKDRRKRKRLLDKYDYQDTSNESREIAPDSDDDTPEKIYEYKSAGQRKSADAKSAQSQAADQEMQEASDRFTNLHKKLKVVSEEEEIENKDVITTREIDQVLQATKELLTRRINFTAAKKKDSYETAFDNMTPLNKEKTVFEFKTKKTANQAKTATANSENGHAASSASETTAAQKSPAKGPVIDEDRSLLDPPYSLYPIEKVMLNMKWRSVTRVGSGLVNHGNTCFMNAALQCLLYTPALANLLFDRKPSQSTKFNALDEMSRLIKVTNAGASVTSPKEIAYNLKAIGKFRLGRQEDSHEFIINILDKMENCVLSQYGNKLDKRVAKTNVINQIFGGYLRSQIKSLQSNYISNTYDPFVDLSLQLTKGTSSIESALREYVTPDVLDGDNKYKCPLTKKYVKATKTLTINRAPPVLIIHLKRFDFLRRKITKHVQFSDVLNLAPFLSDTKQQATYYLHGVLVHQGSTCNSGHYYSFIKASNNIWYEMDDQSVSQVSLKTVLKQNAYILFYSRDYTETDLKKAEAKFKETVAAATTSKEPTPAPQKPSAESKSAPSTPAKSAKASTSSPSKLTVPPPPAAEKEKAPTSPKAAPKQQTPPSTPSTKNVTSSPKASSKSPNSKITEAIFDPKLQNGVKSQSSSQDSVPPSPRPQGSQDIISHDAAERKIDRLRSRSKNGLMSPVTPGAASMIRKKILGLMEERIKLFEAENPPSPSTPSKANLSMEERLNKALEESKSDDIEDDSHESTTQESPKSSPKGSPTKVKTTPFDPKTFIKQMNDQYGEEVDAWDEEAAQQKQELLSKQQAVVNGDKKRKSEWDKLLDRGKVKKVRAKREPEPETWTDGSLEQAASNPFQQESVRRQRKRTALGGR